MVVFRFDTFFCFIIYIYKFFVLFYVYKWYIIEICVWGIIQNVINLFGGRSAFLWALGWQIRVFYILCYVYSFYILNKNSLRHKNNIKREFLEKTKDRSLNLFELCMGILKQKI